MPTGGRPAQSGKKPEEAYAGERAKTAVSEFNRIKTATTVSQPSDRLPGKLAVPLTVPIGTAKVAPVWRDRKPAFSRASDLKSNYRARMANQCTDEESEREQDESMHWGSTAKPSSAERLFAPLVGQALFRFGGLHGSDSVSTPHPPLKLLPDPVSLKIEFLRSKPHAICSM